MPVASIVLEKVSSSRATGRSSSIGFPHFPLAFTGTCSLELKCFTEDYDQFAGKDVEILPISVDSTDALKEFKNKLAMRTELLSDFKRDVSRLYGVLNDEKFYANRAYFLI